MIACSLVPRPFSKRRRKGWYTLLAHVPGDPRKFLGDRIFNIIMHIYIYMHAHIPTRLVTTETRSVAMEMLAHAHAMCTRSFLLLLLKGLGVRLDSFVFFRLKTSEKLLLE